MLPPATTSSFDSYGNTEVLTEAYESFQKLFFYCISNARALLMQTSTKSALSCDLVAQHSGN
jgi:hypothetical protein